MMINWNNAPEYSHKGYIYKPEIEHEDEEGIRKAWHRCVSRVDPTDELVSNATPYRWMTEQEFKEFIDVMAKVTA
tara:strand:+ start:1118 stop:1342 length:225 start_codon:yes stop_codon:yes gene_type:complete